MLGDSIQLDGWPVSIEHFTYVRLNLYNVIESQTVVFCGVGLGEQSFEYPMIWLR